MTSQPQFITLLLILILPCFEGFAHTPLSLSPRNCLLNRRQAVQVQVSNTVKSHAFIGGKRTYYTIWLPSIRTSVEFHTSVDSKYTVVSEGVRYDGKLGFNAHSLKSSEKQYASVFKHLFEIEGKYDAVNTYDKGGFSYGFIQNSALYGELTYFMVKLKEQAPNVFRSFFESRGIYLSEDGKGNKVVSVINQQKRRLKGEEAWNYMAKDIKVIGCFIEAAYHPVVQSVQRKVLVDKYIEPFLNSSFSCDKKTVEGRELVMKDKRILEVMALLCVNTGVSYTRKLFQRGIKQLEKQGKSYNHIDAEIFLRLVKSLDKDTRVTDRIDKVLNASS